MRPETTCKKGGWRAVGPFVENENGKTPEFDIDFSGHRFAFDVEKTQNSMAKRVAVLLNISAGIPTKIIEENSSAFWYRLREAYFDIKGSK